MRSVIAQLINLLPPVCFILLFATLTPSMFVVKISEMKKFLESPRKPGQAKLKLRDMDKTIPDAAWSILRWCVASCTAHLEELRSEDEQVKNIGAHTGALPTLSHVHEQAQNGASFGSVSEPRTQKRSSATR